MYLCIFIIQLIIYILKIINIKIEKYVNDDYPAILKSATGTGKNTRDILVPDTSTLKIFKSCFL